MTRRMTAVLLIVALLGAQPGVPAFAGEVAKNVPLGPANLGGGLGRELPKLDLGDLGKLPAIPNLPVSGVNQLPGLDVRQDATKPAAEATQLPGQAAQPVAQNLAHGQNVALAPATRNAATAQATGFAAFIKNLGGLTRLFAKQDAAKDAKKQDAEGEKALGDFFDGSKLKVFLTEHGAQPVELDGSAVKEYLQANPAYEQKLRQQGRIRLIASKAKGAALNPDNALAVGNELAKAGLVAPIATERIQIAPPTPVVRESALAASDASAKKESFVKSALMYLPREFAYLGRTFKASMSKPSTSEVVGGVVSKGPAFVMSMMWWAKLMLPGHPIAFAVATLFSLTLETFHGIFINTWQNLQNFIGRQRGVTYQTFFNLAYMQLTSAIARIIAWAAIPTTIAPWQAQYWADMGIVTFVGTFVGTLGFQGLNDLYNKGLLSRGQRSAIQQARDLFFLLAGVFFASGSMGIFWPLFIAQQTIDFGLFLTSHFAKARPIAYVAQNDVAASPEFRSMYPVNPGPRKTPLQEAVGALINNPISQLLSWPFRYGYRKWKERSK